MAAATVTGVTAVMVTATVDSATWLRSAVCRFSRASRSASRWVSSDSIAITSPILSALASNALMRSTEAFMVAIRLATSTISSVTSSVFSVRPVTSPIRASPFITASYDAAGMRSVTLIVDPPPSEADTYPPVPGASARTLVAAAEAAAFNAAVVASSSLPGGTVTCRDTAAVRMI